MEELEGCGGTSLHQVPGRERLTGVSAPCDVASSGCGVVVLPGFPCGRLPCVKLRRLSTFSASFVFDIFRGWGLYNQVDFREFMRSCYAGFKLFWALRSDIV